MGDVGNREKQTITNRTETERRPGGDKANNNKSQYLWRIYYMPNDGIFNFLLKILNITVFLLVSFMDVSSLWRQQGKKGNFLHARTKGVILP